MPQRKDLHNFCSHDLSLCAMYNTQRKIIFHSSFFAPVCQCLLTRTYYSPCGPLDITSSACRFYYRNAKFCSEFWYGKYLIVPVWYAPTAQFGLAMGILAPLRLAKIRTMARLNSPDMPPRSVPKRYDQVYVLCAFNRTSCRKYAIFHTYMYEYLLDHHSILFLRFVCFQHVETMHV